MPRQLPAAVRHFAGRADELKALTGLLDSASEATAAVVISAIGGMPGVGKTALAVHWAHLVAARFPGGQLYVNLRGFDPSGTPMLPGEAIRGFLEALQVPADAIPSGLDAQAALYRSLLADSKMLVLLDNARDAEQVRPLLPGGPGCLVAVTSRNPLAGLAAAVGAHLLRLDLLDDSESRELLERHLGRARGAGDEEAARELTGLCARLPLALSIVAARAAAGHGVTLAGLAAELREARGRLDALEIPDAADAAGGGLRAVFWWSYRNLSETAARMFRLLGVHPGPDIIRQAAASLAAVPLAHASVALGELVSAQLVTEHAPGRFALHDLLRAYATERASACDTGAGRRAALHRALDHYLHTAHRAGCLLYPADEPVILAAPRPGTAPEQLTSHRQALAWLTAEHSVLIAAISSAADGRLDIHAWQLPAVLRDYFARRARWHDWAQSERLALAAARRLGDQAAQARAHRGLGEVSIQFEAYEDALAHLRHALDLYRCLGDWAGEGITQFGISRISRELGDYPEALCHAKLALGLFQQLGYRGEQAWALNAVGALHGLLGRPRLAVSYCQFALRLHRELGCRFGEAVALDSLGYCRYQTGRYTEAIVFYQHAVTLYREVGDRFYRAGTLDNLGDAYRAAGDADAARESWQQALAILSDLRHSQASQVRARLRDLAETS